MHSGKQLDILHLSRRSADHAQKELIIQCIFILLLMFAEMSLPCIDWEK